MSSFTGDNEPCIDFHRRFGASFHEANDDELEYGQDEEIDIERTAALSTIERAAHEDTIKTLMDMFPSWSHNELEALLSSCGDSMDTAIEEIMRLGEGGSLAAQAAIDESDEYDGNSEAPSGVATQQIDLSSQMTRMQLDDYERHVIMQLREEKVEEKITIAIAVPFGAQPGGSLNVRMVDGSKYTVSIPMGLQPGDKFLAEFPTAPMRQAAMRRLTHKPPASTQSTPQDDFLSVVEGRSSDNPLSGGGATDEASGDEEEDEDEAEELEKALAQSLLEQNKADDRAKKLQEEEEEQIKIAMMQSEMSQDPEVEARPTETHFF